MVTLDRPRAMPLARGAHARSRELARLAVIAALVPLAFAAPGFLGLSSSMGTSDEVRLGRAMMRAFGGISLPLVAALVAAIAFAKGAPLRARIDRLVAAGLDPASAAPRVVLPPLLVASVVPAIVGAITVTSLRIGHHLGGGRILALDAAGTAWGVFLGAAAWTSIATLLVIGSGRGGRAFWMILGELALRVLPGAAAWLSPSAHVANLLGAPPPRSLVLVPVLPQWVSVVTLATIAIACTGMAMRRYRAISAG